MMSPAADPPSPFDRWRGTVRPEWLDYNGHMNVAFYGVAFDQATDVLFEALGLGPAYLAATGCSLFALEQHLIYERELPGGAPLAVATRLLHADDKRIHFFHEMRHAAEGWRAATAEFLAIHIDMAGRRSRPFPPDRREGLDQIVAAHGRLAPDPVIGRRIAWPPSRPGRGS